MMADQANSTQRGPSPEDQTCNCLSVELSDESNFLFYAYMDTNS